MHTHATDEEIGPVRIGRGARITVLGLLAVVAVAVAVGLVALWPSSAAVHRITSNAQFSAPGVSYPTATVVKVSPACPVVADPTDEAPATTASQPAGCGLLTARLDSGRTVQVSVAPEVSRSGLRPGDGVQLMRIPARKGAPAQYSYWTTQRDHALLWAGIAFVILVLVVARLRGLMALVGLGVGGAVLVGFLLPALLVGENGLWVALAGTAAIMYVVLYLTHGPSMRTSVALLGTLAGIAVTAAVGVRLVDSARLTGVTDESGGVLAGLTGGIDFHGLLMCGVVVAGLGVLNDVTITQASAVWELRAAAPTRSRRSIFLGAMRIGRDHIASSIYTIVFAYAGAALVVLLILVAYDQPVLSLLSAEDIAEEVVRTLASGIGLLLAMPVTTALAAALAGPQSPAVVPETWAQEPRTSEAAYADFWSGR